MVCISMVSAFLGIWRDAMIMLEEYAEKFKSINVILGPIFDYNYDGLDDSPSDILRFALRFQLWMRVSAALQLICFINRHFDETSN
jgi:hypothetical protein